MSIRTDFTLSEYLELRAQERNEKSRHVAYKFFPDIRSMNTVVFWGVFSWAIPANKERWLRKNTMLTDGKYLSTPGDVVRDYLDYYHPMKLRAIRAEALTYENQSSAPLYITASTIQNAMYIDVSSTYYSIVKLTGWNVGYLKEKWLTPGRAPLDFPIGHDKAGRNYLVSIGLKTPMTMWTGTRMVQKHAPNVHTNQALWALVQDILNSIALTAVYLGAKYVHTDGYIVPAKNGQLLMKAIRDWGLSPRIIAEGPALICGFGNYMVGEKRTKHFDPAKRRSAPYSNLRTKLNGDWLKYQVNEITRRGIPQRLFEEGLSL